jgi:hypothetical protein
MCDALEYGAVSVMAITRKLSPGDPGTANDVRSQRETSIHNGGDMPQRIFAPRRGPAVGLVARARVSLMVPDYTSIAAAILLGIAGQNALKSAANGSATVIAQFLNPLTIIGLAILSSRPSKRFQSQSPSLGATRSSHILWNEPLGWPQMAGIVMIGGGVLLVRQH